MFLARKFRHFQIQRHFSILNPLIYNSPHNPVDIPENKTTWDIIYEKRDLFHEKPALICGISGKTMKFHEFYTAVQKAATSLAKLGVKKNDIVLTNAINSFEYPILFHALTLLGATLSTASPQFNATELLQQLKSSGAKFLVTHTAVKDSAIEAGLQYGLSPKDILCIGTDVNGCTPFSDLLAIQDDEIDIPKEIIDTKTDISLLPYSSGTTGPPKGVMLSHFNVLANTIQVDAIEKFENATLLLLPMFHIYPFLLMNLSLLQGVAQVILPKFEPESFLNALQTYRIPKVHLVPPVAIFLAKHPLVDQYDISQTKYLVSAAAPLGTETEELVKKRLNLQFKQAYGMTELSPCTHYATDDQLKNGSIGHPVPSTEIRIVSTSTHKDLPPYETGEIWTRGPQVMLGYKDNPTATNDTVMSDGFLRTGDIGFVDEDGFTFIVDRVKELIKYKGHQIAPAELENVLLTHPTVADTACIRSFDADGEEFPKAYVVLKEGQLSTEQELMEYVAEHVAPYKKIRAIEFIDAIPKTATGKILRRELQARET